MPSRLSFDDFKPLSITSELRYKNAYLIFDHTGHILKEIRESFSEINTVAATPQQSTFATAEGTFVIELGTCRFTSGQPDKDAETFARHCKVFFDAVADQFQINIYTRIGLRYILRTEFKTEKESKDALASMMLANLKPTKRFNSSDSPTEVLFRWEDTEIGATVRLKAETTDIKMNIPPELQMYVPKFEKKIIGLTLDTDYYTVAPVERQQWDANEWLLQKFRIIRKEVDDIVRGGK
jgi:uncharacterized protein (TIGR04255 family)